MRSRSCRCTPLGRTARRRAREHDALALSYSPPVPGGAGGEAAGTQRAGFKVYIGNIAHVAGEDEVRALCGRYGAVQSLNLVFDKATNRRKGFGFVEFAEEAAARECVVGLNGHSLHERQLKVSVAEGKKEPAVGSGGEGGGAGPGPGPGAGGGLDDEGGGANGSGDPAGSKRGGDGECFDFKMGRCTRGAQCRWAHVGESGAIRVTASEPGGGGGAKRARREYATDGRAWVNESCWFCLASPQFEAHFVVSVAEESYVAMAKGPLLPMHCLILPIAHVPCSPMLPPRPRRSQRLRRSPRPILWCARRGAALL